MHGDAVSLPSWRSDFTHGILIFRKDLLNNLSCVEFEVFVGASPDSGWYCQTLGVPPSQVCFNREELDPKRPQHSMETWKPWKSGANPTDSIIGQNSAAQELQMIIHKYQNRWVLELDASKAIGFLID